MKVVQLRTDHEAAEAPPGPTSQQRGRDNDEDMDTGESRRNHQRTAASAALSDSSTKDNGEPSALGKEEAASEDETYASLVETAFFVCSQEY